MSTSQTCDMQHAASISSATLRRPAAVFALVSAAIFGCESSDSGTSTGGGTSSPGAQTSTGMTSSAASAGGSIGGGSGAGTGGATTSGGGGFSGAGGTTSVGGFGGSAAAGGLASSSSTGGMAATGGAAGTSGSGGVGTGGAVSTGGSSGATGGSGGGSGIGGTGGAPATCGCPDTSTECAALCVSRDDPTNGCGQCTPCKPPHATAGCAQGACTIAACDSGFANCNAVASDGCETDLALPTSCGACGTQCATGEVCSPNGCAASCSPPLTNCNGACVDLLTSVTHCGTCSTVCPWSEYLHREAACVNASCTTGACWQGYTACGSVCVDLTNDPKNCGICGNSCPATSMSAPSCTSSVCAPCGNGFVQCGSLCIDPKTDIFNCGACGNACPSNETCVGAQCVAPQTLFLATNLTAPTGLAVDDTNVYWSSAVTNSVYSVPKTGGTPTVFASGQSKPTGVQADGAEVFWANELGGAVMVAAKGSVGSPTVLAPAATPSSLTIDQTNVYWFDAGSSIKTVAKIGGSVSTVIDATNVMALAVDAAYIYYVYVIVDSQGSNYEIAKVPKTGGTPAPAVVGTGPGSTFTGVQVSGDRIFTRYQYMVDLLAIDATTQSNPYLDPPAFEYYVPCYCAGGVGDFVVDTDNVYFVAFNTNHDRVGILRAPICTTGHSAHAFLAAQTSVVVGNPIRLAVDAAYVYWIADDSGGVYHLARVPKY